jgi:hypothetical protein
MMKSPFDDPLHTYVERMLDDQRRHEELLRWSKPDYLDPIIKPYLTADHIAKMTQPVSVNIQSAIESIGGLALQDEFLLLTKNITASLQRGNSFIDSMEQIAQFESKRLEDLFLGYKYLEQMADQKRALESALAPIRQVEAALASIEASTRIFDVPSIHWSNSLSLVEDYETFAIRQVKAGKRDGALVAQRRARVTELAGELLTTSVAAAELGAELAESEEPVEGIEISQIRPYLYGPLNQHLGFVYRVDLAVDVDPAVAKATPTRICELGGALIVLVTRIIQRSHMVGKEVIFRVTARCLPAASLIPSFVAGSEVAFGEIVDALYFLLYEAAGGTNNRLTDIVSDEVLAPLWRLKHLRLHYRHDIEHGDERDINKKYKIIAAAFRSLCRKDLPSRPREWTLAQVNLYAQLVSMLEKVEEALTGP